MDEEWIRTFESIPTQRTIYGPVTATNTRPIVEYLNETIAREHGWRPLAMVDVNGVLCVRTLHGFLPVDAGCSIVAGADEAYPITADELTARYREVSP